MGFEGVAEVVKTARLLRVTLRDEVNSIPVPRNCILEVTQLPEAIETSEGGVAEGTKTTRLVRVTMGSEVNSTPVLRNCVLEATQLADTFKTSKEEFPRLLRRASLPG